MEQAYRQYMETQIEQLLRIDSTTGFYQEIEAYLAKEVMKRFVNCNFCFIDAFHRKVANCPCG